MRKSLCFLSAIVMVACVTGCGGDPEADDDDPSSSGGGGTSSGGGGTSSSGGGLNPDGGPVECTTPPCAGGAECTDGSECASGICKESRCIDQSANDGVKNGTETDIDCGGPSAGTPRCASGKQCVETRDCNNVLCTGSVCQPPRTNDGIKNGAETDIDCGGPDAPRCATGKACVETSDCNNVLCTDLVCQPVTAGDGLKNGTETDVDCGGAEAPACATGQTCLVTADCDNVLCTDSVCQPPTAVDGLKNGTETAKDCGGGEPTNAPRCPTGQACIETADCDKVLCTGQLCQPPTAVDGIQNGTESDKDCGGGAPTNARRCNENEMCGEGSDCDSRFCTAGICEPRKAGRKDGDETDIDCGGLVAPACNWGLGCALNDDCESNRCVAGTCAAPSCGRGPGGNTCGPTKYRLNGTPYYDDDCCKSLPVPGKAIGGKQVYLDKYEITAGRMRQFVETVGPNIKAYMADHRPARWNLAWEAILPQGQGINAAGQWANNQPGVTYTIANMGTAPAFDPATRLNPAFALKGFMYIGQQEWASGHNELGGPTNGDYTIYPGIAQTFGGQIFFREYGDSAYATSHAFNCGNAAGSYGVGTYWLPDAALTAINGATSYKRNSVEKMDEHALNCTTFAMFAAFCAWDGGQLVTNDVMTTVMSGVVVPTSCSGANVTGDGSQGCYAFYDAADNDYIEDSYDSSKRIFRPGKVAADVHTIAPNVEGWYDLRGNLIETTLNDNDDRFWYKGRGYGYSSILDHHNKQIRQPRAKNGEMGARCMRLK